MFHTGDLTSGIGKAVQENKLVVCFVRADDDDASEVWEKEWLGAPSDHESTTSFGDLLSTKAVILRLQFGTQEANFLNAFSQITEPPTLVIIHNGQVLEKLEGDVTKEEFVNRISKATKLDEPAAPSPSQPLPTTSQADTQAASQSAANVSATQPAQEMTASSRPPSSPPPPAMQNLFPDRAQHHAAEQARRDAAEKAERSARAAARKKEAEEANVTSTSSTTSSKAQASARRDWLVQQKQRQDEAKKEKARILAQIEADKQNRKARAQAAKHDVDQPASESIAAPSQSSSTSKSSSSTASRVSLQIRLFDGSSIKSRFPPTATLAADVRQWIRENTSTTTSEQSSDIPYTFRQILTPAPPRAIGVSEEHQSLRALDLIPSATLVLVPVSGYADAYSGAEGGYLGAAWNLASGLLGSVAGFVPGLSGIAGSPSAGSTSNDSSKAAQTNFSSSSSSSAAPSSSIGGGINNNTNSSRLKVKTLADQRAEAAAENSHRKGASGADDDDGRETEFYNGNSLGFEGRPKDIDGNPDGGDEEGGTKRRKGKGKERDD